MRRPVNRFFPADLFPVIAARRTVKRRFAAVFRIRYLAVAQSLAAKRTAVHRTICRPFEVDEFAFLYIADHPAAAGAEMADRGKLSRPFQFEFPCGSPDFRHIESQTGQRKADAAETCGFQEVTSAQIHQSFLLQSPKNRQIYKNTNRRRAGPADFPKTV